MAYKTGDPLLLRKPIFLAASKVITWFIELLGWPLMRFLYGFRIKGRENLKTAGIGLRRKGRKPHIVVSNHVLPLDPLLHGLSLLPRFTYFTLLEETVLTPVLGTFVRLLGGIPVPYAPGRLDDIEAAVGEGLRGRGLVHLYPEGECFLLSQEIAPFKAGAFYYAIKFGVPVLPIVTVIRSRAGRAAPPPDQGSGPVPRGAAAQTAVQTAAQAAPQTPTPDFLLGVSPGFSLGSSTAPRILASTHILPAVAPPPSSGRAATDLHNAIIFSRTVRALMQACIEAEGGDKSLYRGPMPRIRGVNDRER